METSISNISISSPNAILNYAVMTYESLEKVKWHVATKACGTKAYHLRTIKSFVTFHPAVPMHLVYRYLLFIHAFLIQAIQPYPTHGSIVWCNIPIKPWMEYTTYSLKRTFCKVYGQLRKLTKAQLMNKIKRIKSVWAASQNF